MSEIKGLKKAISYSLKPHELGYCGPQDTEKTKVILRDYLLGKDYPASKIKNLLKEFHGSYAYYELIAQKNNIKNVFDEKVIEAYWIGNSLLTKIKKADIKNLILTEFTKPGLLSKEKAKKIIKKIPDKFALNHSFHVFFVGSITNRVKLDKGEKEKCKTGWGKILDINKGKNKLKIQTTTLFPFQKNKIITIDWDENILPRIKKIYFVAYHWGRAVEKLTKQQFRNLEKYTLINYEQQS